MFLPSRRQLLQLAPAGLVLPRSLLAAPKGGERRFLFIYAYGGWDITMVFAPMFGNPNVDTEQDATTAEANGITFVDQAERPSVRRFFENYGDRTCVINGMEVRSVTHERCKQILFTGSNGSTAEDWAVLAAAGARDVYPAPHLVLSGPAFAGLNQSKVVRAGSAGQLVALMDGSALRLSDQPVSLLSASGEGAEDAFVASRIAQLAGRSGGGGLADQAVRYGAALDDLSLLGDLSASVDLSPEFDGCRRDIASDGICMLNAFQAGLSRCAITEDRGWCQMTWDTHSNNSLQVRHYEELFGYLEELMIDLDGRTSTSGAPLRDEVTIVVFSEMGRHPQITGSGRAHWTYTSAMLIGSGIQGGQVIGAMDDQFTGMPVDLATGDTTDSGTALVPGNLGATLLALADIDWKPYTPQSSPILAATTL